jgi:hypothetical protein
LVRLRYEEATWMSEDVKKHGPSAGRINVAGRINKVVVGNVGGSGSSHGVSSSQKVRIRQDRTGTYEDVETIERSVHPSGGATPPVEDGRHD